MAWAHPSKYSPRSGPVSLSLPAPPDRDVHRLVFPAVGPQHAGVYKSVIANKLGKAACYAHLYVTGETGTLPASYMHSLASGLPRGLVKRGGFCTCSLPSIPWGTVWPRPCPQPTPLRPGDPVEPLGPKGPSGCLTFGFQMWFQAPQMVPHKWWL